MSIPELTPVDGAQSPAERVFPVFPPELERKIFLLTARTHRGAPTHLMLVASRVKTWIQPFVYKTVLLLGEGHAVRFLGALTSYHSPEFAKSHVKALCIPPSIPLTLTIQLLAACPGLESLALWILPQTDTADLVNLITSLPLTFLSVNLRCILPLGYSKPVLQNHPALVNLTHLDIVNHRVLWKSSLGIEELPLLTHVAFRFWPRGSVHAALLTILGQSPKLRVLLLLADSVVIHRAREYLEKQEIQDIRVVVLKHVRDVDEWELMERGSASMWQRAECIVRWRQFNRAGPFDFPSELSSGSAEPCDAEACE